MTDLIKKMTDWRLEVDLAYEYDWRRLPNNVTGGSAYRFLADRTNGRAIGTVLRLSVCRLYVTLCIVAKRCVLEQKLLWRAYRKSYMRNRLVPK